MGVRGFTRIDIGELRHFRLTDPRLFDNPWIYATQTGWWGLGPKEIERLREYLLRGGFLVVDDFWGPEQWEIFRLTHGSRVPRQAHRRHRALATPSMHVLYDIEEKDLTWIPGTRTFTAGSRRGDHGAAARRHGAGWRAISDDRDRMVVAVNFNTDVGDAWEYADSPMYPEPMTALAYRYGLNYLVYSMTH